MNDDFPSTIPSTIPIHMKFYKNTDIIFLWYISIFYSKESVYIMLERGCKQEAVDPNFGSLLGGSGALATTLIKRLGRDIVTSDLHLAHHARFLSTRP